LTQLDVATAPAEPTTRSPEPEPAGPDRRVGALALLLVVAAVFALAVWVVSPRFEIDTPSLVDDWASLSRSGDQVADLLRLRNPEEQRFVPSLALWSWLQWHTFDAPSGLVGPNAWNLLRILVLVAGLTLLTAVALPRRRDPGGVWGALLHAALAGIPAFAVVTVPKFARDMARFGPQEPMLVGALALGGALLVLAARSLLAPSPVPRRVVALTLAGSLVWVFGAYHKETSVCALPLLAAVAWAGRGRLGEWGFLSRARKVVLGVLAAVVLLPLVHVAVAGARLAARGDLIYGADVEGGGDVWSGFVDLYDWAHEAMPENARLLMWAALALTALVAVVRRKLDVIALGALASGVASLALAGQSGVLATRYYIPAYALFAVAFALSLARLPAPVRLAGVLCVLFAFVPLPDTRGEVERWTAEEVAGAAVVQEVAALDVSGCALAIEGVDPETTQALPVLVRLQSEEARTCGDARAYLLLHPNGENTTLYSACAEGALQAVVESPLVHLHRCGRLADGPVRDPELGEVTPERLLELQRFDAAAG
jgi:hypothetical protein